MVKRDVERLFQNYQYGEAGRQVYDFFWNEFADWYLEIAKLQLAKGDLVAYSTARQLVQVLDTCLRLLHPFTPFVTEEIWGHLKSASMEVDPPIYPFDQPKWEEALIIARWPEPTPANPWQDQVIADFSLVMDVVRAIRNLRAEKNINPKQRIPATMIAGEQTSILQKQSATISALARLDPDKLIIQETLADKPADHVALVIGAVEVYLPITTLVDTAEQRARLEKDLAETNSQIERLQALLAGPFKDKAPANVVEKEEIKLLNYQQKAEKIKSQLASMT
jgi:valyl-tRNA synthetase